MVTGYYEPLLRGSRTRTSRYRYPIYAVPQDLLVIDLSSVYPDLKHKRLRGRIEGNRVVPYLARGGHREGSRAAQGPRDRLGRRPGRALLPAHPGLRPGAARERRAPARGIRGPERASLPLARTAAHPARGTAAGAHLDAGNQGLGAPPSGEGAALHEREPELRLLPRAARATFPGPSARSACRSPRSARSRSIRA